MTAKDLLHKHLDYQYLWSMPDRINDQPSKIRRQQLEALQDAFGLSKKYVNPLTQIEYFGQGDKEGVSRVKKLNGLSNIDYLRQGEFLHDRDKEKNKKLADRALEKIKELYEYVPEDQFRRRVDIGWMFNSLLNFRQEIYNVSYPNGGMLEGFSVGLLYSHYLQGQLKKIIIENLDEIDETLWLILDPEQREIDVKTLTEKFNYPDEDLNKIDLV